MISIYSYYNYFNVYIFKFLNNNILTYSDCYCKTVLTGQHIKNRNMFLRVYRLGSSGLSYRQILVAHGSLSLFSFTTGEYLRLDKL